MLNYTVPILVDTPKRYEYIEILLSSDLHTGSREFDAKRFKRFEELIKPANRYIVFAGDLMENATKDSKSDVYTAERPMVQKEYLLEVLSKYKEKILCMVDGNHEYNRSSRTVDYFPLYDIAVALGIKDRYRSEAAFLDVGVGMRIDDRVRQRHYVAYVTHKAKRLKEYSLSDAIDGIDVMVYGHDHQPSDRPTKKLVYDAHNKMVREKNVENVDCGSFLNYGGYSVRSGYRPTSDKLYILRLYGETKRIETIGYYA